MLEILKANVLIAYQQLEQYQLDRYGRGVVSAIDRNRDMAVIKTAQQSVLVSLKDDNWERGLDAETISSIRTHIALYRAFPQIGGIARPHARNATIFAQLGMDIPVLGLFHKRDDHNISHYLTSLSIRLYRYSACLTGFS